MTEEDTTVNRRRSSTVLDWKHGRSTSFAPGHTPSTGWISWSWSGDGTDPESEPEVRKVRQIPRSTFTATVV